MHQFKDNINSKVAEHDYQNFAIFMQDMNELYDDARAMKKNQHDGQMGKDPNVTKAHGAAYNADPHSATQARYQALLTNKEILKVQT